MEKTATAGPPAAARVGGTSVEVPRLPPKATAREALRCAFAEAAVGFVTAGVDLDRRASSVHEARDAIRRLRCDLRTYGSLIDPGWDRSLRDDLQWLAAGFGELGDADIVWHRVERQAGRSTEMPVQTLESLTGRRDDARRRLLRQLLDDRYELTMERLATAATDPPTNSDASKKAKAVLVPRLAAAHDDLKRWVALAGDADDDLRRVRIWAERVRYAAGVVSPVGSDHMRRYARRAERLRVRLVEQRSAALTLEWLRDLGVPESEARAVGRVEGLEMVAVMAAGARWRAAWKKLDSPKSRRALR